MGGEEFRVVSCFNPPWGLPPRGRGRAKFKGNGKIAIRITPAWAGKSGSINCTRRGCKDYPRVGGEELGMRIMVPLLPGLPPRGRGRDQANYRNWEQSGITPAWAGKRSMLKPIMDNL